MTYQNLFSSLAPEIEKISQERPLFELQILAGSLLGLSREKLLLIMHEETSPEFSEAFGKLVERRARGESIAYLIGTREFYEHKFHIGPGVLVPRPETEILLEWVLEDFDRGSIIRLHDFCTGSGCIPLSIKSERPDWQISASDISSEALSYAVKNLSLIHPLTIELFEANLDVHDFFKKGKFDIITANPPYVPHAEVEQRMSEGWTEPRLALDGGQKGFEFIEILLAAVKNCLKTKGRFYLEFGDNQEIEIMTLLSTHGFSDIQIKKDLQGLPRIARAELR